jgi:hypothetical protein
LFGLVFDPEDGDDMFVAFQRPTRRYIAEVTNIHPIRKFDWQDKVFIQNYVEENLLENVIRK